MLIEESVELDEADWQRLMDQDGLISGSSSNHPKSHPAPIVEGMTAKSHDTYFLS